jgi:hypothetical protein
MVTKNELIKTAKKYIDADLSVLPMSKKRPVCKWLKYQETKATYSQIEYEFQKTNATHIGLFGGYGNVEIIDVDISHDPTKLIWNQYSDMLKAHLPELFSRLVIDQSVRGGVHIYYRSKNSGRNKRLAYIKEGKALKELIGIKGKGGYVIISPSEGYTAIQGSLLELPWVESDERDLMISLARSFDLRPLKKERVYNGK